MRLITLVLIFVLSGSVVLAADDAGTLLAQAKAAATAKNTVQAVSLYTSFLDKYPKDSRAAEASYSLAEAYLQMQDYVGAATHYKRVIDTAPQSEFATLAMFRVGEIPYLLEKYDIAKPLLISFIQQRPLDPCNRFVLYYLGDIAMQRGDEKEAAYYFGECLQLFPTGERADDAKRGMAWVAEKTQQIQMLPTQIQPMQTQPAQSDDEKLQQAITLYTQRDYAGALAIIEPLLGIEYLTIPAPRLTISYNKTDTATAAPPTIPGFGSLTQLTPITPVDTDKLTGKLTATSLNQACSLLTLCYAMKGDAVRAQAAMTMFKTQAASSDATAQDIVQQTEQLLTQVLATNNTQQNNTQQPSESQSTASQPRRRPGLAPLPPQTTPTQSSAQLSTQSPVVGGVDIDAGDYRKTLQTARSLLKSRQYSQADALLTRLLAQDISGSVAAEALFLKAETLVALKRTSEAITFYEQIIANHGTSRYTADALWSLGLVYERRGDSVAASEYFQQLVEQFSDFAQIDGALYYLAWNDIDNGAGNRASGYLQRVDRQHSHGVYWSHAVWTLAWLAARANNPDGANDYLDKILSRAPDEAIYDRVLYLKGRLAMDRKLWETANVAFQELRRVRPDSPFRDAADQATSLVRNAAGSVR